MATYSSLSHLKVIHWPHSLFIPLLHIISYLLLENLRDQLAKNMFLYELNWEGPSIHSLTYKVLLFYAVVVAVDNMGESQLHGPATESILLEIHSLKVLVCQSSILDCYVLSCNRMYIFTFQVTTFMLLERDPSYQLFITFKLYVFVLVHI